MVEEVGTTLGDVGDVDEEEGTMLGGGNDDCSTMIAVGDIDEEEGTILVGDRDDDGSTMIAVRRY